MHTDRKISDRIARGHAMMNRAIPALINPISMRLVCAIAAIVVFDAVSTWKPLHE